MTIKIKHYETVVEIETNDSSMPSNNNEYILKIVKEVFNQIVEIRK
jgi:hypothetical protein